MKIIWSQSKSETAERPQSNGSLSQIMSDNYGLFRRGVLVPIAYLAVDAQAAHRSVVLSQCTELLKAEWQDPTRKT